MSDWHAHMRTACGARPIAFYEKVKVLDIAGDEALRGRYGWVLGVSAEDGADLIQGYGVWFEEFGQVVSVEPQEIEATGEIAPRSQFYDEDALPLRVRVDDRGRGHIFD